MEFSNSLLFNAKKKRAAPILILSPIPS